MLETHTKHLIQAQLEQARKVVIITHSNPDGDAIGSSLGLALALGKNGHEASVVIPDGLPDFLRWLPGIERSFTFAYKREKAMKLIEQAELIFCLDFNEVKRMGEVETAFSASRAYKILVDHHENPKDFTDLTISESWRGSVGEMVYHLIEELLPEGSMDRDIATCLYVAIMTDTGNFSFASSYPEIFSVVSELLKQGIDKDLIYSRVYDAFSESRMRLQGYCMQEKLVLLPEYSTAYIYLSDEELKRFNYRKGDTEGFVNIPFAIKGVKFTAFFVEKKDRIRVSLRSRDNFPANRIASEHFQGGGHINAAGGDSFDNMDMTRQKFEALLEDYKELLSHE